MCVTPEGDNSLVLSKNCSKSRFEFTPGGDFIYTPTSLCVQPLGGRRDSQPGTKVVLHKICGREENRFQLYTGPLLNVPRQIVFGPKVSPANRPKKVALSILIVKCGSVIDSAAVLVQSVINAKSKYNIDLIALVSKEVQTCRPALKTIGFKVLEKELPLQPEEIRNPQIAREIINDGCCGMWELLKLHVWTLTEYDRVIQLDTDILFHRNFDELFEYDSTLVWTHGGLGGSERMNGGFLVVRPNPSHYDAMVEIIKSGDFRGGQGWRGKCCWVYGGRTIQGILPYYYLYEQVDAHQEVDRCKYNNMVEIDRCMTWNYNNVTSNHFTVCQKPFHCTGAAHNRLCREFQNKWWELSRDVEISLGLSPRQECPSGRYHEINWEHVPAGKVLHNPSLSTHY
uniref:Hexosyltransferase n=1 Tax=Amorphochlora amoebiformis TaxID=1561963 RepID=A0A7S0CN35_9EUKA|mmetsp:Transcript_10576/g.16732  ORF Transcript_10576/g.16732 Transcript_10576/m.16732 type:complete len:398 (+) Transcript_10576:342-1535(+)